MQTLNTFRSSPARPEISGVVQHVFLIASPGDPPSTHRSSRQPSTFDADGAGQRRGCVVAGAGSDRSAASGPATAGADAPCCRRATSNAS